MKTWMKLIFLYFLVGNHTWRIRLCYYWKYNDLSIVWLELNICTLNRTSIALSGRFTHLMFRAICLCLCCLSVNVAGSATQSPDRALSMTQVMRGLCNQLFRVIMLVMNHLWTILNVWCFESSRNGDNGNAIVLWYENRLPAWLRTNVTNTINIMTWRRSHLERTKN